MATRLLKHQKLASCQGRSAALYVGPYCLSIASVICLSALRT